MDEDWKPREHDHLVEPLFTPLVGPEAGGEAAGGRRSLLGRLFAALGRLVGLGRR